MVFKELLGPINLSGAQTLGIHELTEVIIVRKDENLMFTAFQVIAPCFEGFDNS